MGSNITGCDRERYGKSMFIKKVHFLLAYLPHPLCLSQTRSGAELYSEKTRKDIIIMLVQQSLKVECKMVFCSQNVYTCS